MNNYDLISALEPVWDALEYRPNVDWISEDSFSLEVEGEDATYALMEKLANLFGTKNINIVTETRSSGGCETCNFEWQQTLIVVKDVAYWPQLTKPT